MPKDNTNFDGDELNNRLVAALEPITSRIRVDVTALKRNGKMIWTKERLTKSRLLAHVSTGPFRGCCPINEGESTTRLALLDLDSHKGQVPWPEMEKHCARACEELERLGYYPIAFRSSGGKGCHIFLIWNEPQDAYSVREFLGKVIESVGYKPGAVGGGVAAGEIEIFPKQNNVLKGGYGNQFILPLAGKSVPLLPILGYAPGNREDALYIEWQVSPPVPVLEIPKAEFTRKRQHFDGNLAELEKRLEHIDPDLSYDSWLRVLAAIHQETQGSEEGLYLADAWSSGGSTYKGPDEIERKWKSFKLNKPKPITAGYIKKLSEEGGYLEDYTKDFENVGEGANDSEYKQNAGANRLWPNPDLMLFRCEDIAPPSFDPASLPPAWTEWCAAMAKAKACPIDFIALNLLVSASAWLGNSRHVAAINDYVEPPHIWGAIIVPPSGGKTPSQQPFIEVCKILETDAEPAWESECVAHEKKVAYAAEKYKIWEKAVADAAKDGIPAPDLPPDAMKPDAPAKPRVLLCDATSQEIVNLLSRNPKGLLLLRDELSGWIGSFDRYSGSGADRGFFLECWNGGRYSVDLVRNAGKTIAVPFASLAILGGMQPDKLREALAGADDGFAARFCYVWPRLIPYTPLDQKNSSASNDRFEFLLTAARRLRSFHMKSNNQGNPVAHRLPLSQEALGLFENIRRDASGKARTMKGLAAGWHGKTPARALRLALTIELLTWAVAPNLQEATEVSAESMAHAGKYLDYLGAMFDRVIGGLAADEAEADAVTIMHFIVNHKRDILNERELYQMTGFGHFRKEDRRKAAFKILEREVWIRRASTTGTGRKPGNWEINPKLWSAIS